MLKFTWVFFFFISVKFLDIERMGYRGMYLTFIFSLLQIYLTKQHGRPLNCRQQLGDCASPSVLTWQIPLWRGLQKDLGTFGSQRYSQDLVWTSTLGSVATSVLSWLSQTMTESPYSLQVTHFEILPHLSLIRIAILWPFIRLDLLWPCVRMDTLCPYVRMAIRCPFVTVVLA